MIAMAERLADSGMLASASSNASPIEDDDRASLGARALAFILDSVLLFGFCMAFGAAAFLVIFVGSDTGRNTISDGEEWGFVAFLLATFPAWFAFNVGLMSMRGHTVGQYVIGLRTVRADGGKPSANQVGLYWLALHPVLFHPFLALPWLLFATLGVTFASSEALFVFALAIALLCLVGPLVNIIFVAIDPQRRGVHDRLGGIKVARLQP
jgi:uncharacterized RDD family membrane protein YckC